MLSSMSMPVCFLSNPTAITGANRWSWESGHVVLEPNGTLTEPWVLFFFFFLYLLVSPLETIRLSSSFRYGTWRFLCETGFCVFHHPLFLLHNCFIKALREKKRRNCVNIYLFIYFVEVKNGKCKTACIIYHLIYEANLREITEYE